MNTNNTNTLLDDWLYRLDKKNLVDIIHSLVSKMTKEEKNEKSEESIMNRKLFVRNLAFETRERDLLEFFSQYGHVEEIEIKYEKDGRSKGFAFVTFYHSLDAKNALENKVKTICGRTTECFLAVVGKKDRPKNTYSQ